MRVSILFISIMLLPMTVSAIPEDALVLERPLIRIDEVGLHSMGTFYIKNFEDHPKTFHFELNCLNGSCVDECPDLSTKVCINNDTVHVRTSPSSDVTPHDRAQAYLSMELAEGAGDHRYQLNLTAHENGSEYASKTLTLLINEGKSYDEPTSLNGFRYIALAAAIFSLSAFVFALVSVVRTH